MQLQPKKRERGEISNIVFGYLKPPSPGAAPTLGLICASSLRFQPESFALKDFSHVHFRADARGDLTNLIVEQTKRANVQASLLRTFLAPEKARTTPIDRQSLRSLLGQWQSSQGLQKSIRGELMRRAASGALPLVLGLVGLQAGLRAALLRRSMPLCSGALLAVLIFLLNIAGKSLTSNWMLAGAAYLGIPALVALYSVWRIHRVRLA